MPKKLTLVLTVVCALTGCDREPGVAQSSQPKDTSVATVPPAPTRLPIPGDHPPVQPGTTMPAMGQPAAEAGLAWSTPAAWREDKTPRPMREATLVVEEGEKAAEVVVTRLGGQYGGFAANMNRWRGQVGLEPLDDVMTVGGRDIKSGAGDLKVYTIAGPTKGMVVGVLERGDFTWFFKLVGDKGTVTQNVPAFDQFLQSLRIMTAGDK
jgi:hypothetical protein